MKSYKAIFFDWDGTAVENRTNDASRAIRAMKQLLNQGIRLVIVSGTTYENILNGEFSRIFTKEELSFLFLGLARGSYHYGFDSDKQPVLLEPYTLSMDSLLKLHDACFQIHQRLLRQYHLETDIIFSRPGYCKIDLMVYAKRTDKNLFLQENEVQRIQEILDGRNIKGGLYSLIREAVETGLQMGLDLKATTDAKYLEVGYTTKTDNVRYFMNAFGQSGITAKDCCFWGDEFGAIAPGIWGSDSQMITQETIDGDFFSVSNLSLPLPKQVKQIGGGIDSFLQFLENQRKE